MKKARILKLKIQALKEAKQQQLQEYTPEWLRKFKGLEQVSDEVAHYIIESLQRCAETIVRHIFNINNEKHEKQRSIFSVCKVQNSTNRSRQP